MNNNTAWTIIALRWTDRIDELVMKCEQMAGFGVIPHDQDDPELITFLTPPFGCYGGKAYTLPRTISTAVCDWDLHSELTELTGIVDGDPNC